MSERGSSRQRPWYHKHLGRMETERLLMEGHEDGAFVIRESDTVKGAYVLSTIYQKRIHHYRILPGDAGKLSIQAQQGVQRKQFSALDDLVEYYSQPKRGLVCGLTTPISPSREEEPQEPDEESDDDDEVSREKNIISKFLAASLSTLDTSSVEPSFLEALRSYLHNDVSTDLDSMATPMPSLSHLKQLFASDCEKLHWQLDKLMSQVDLLQSLFERAGGAKNVGVVSTMARKRRSKQGDVDYDSLGFKLNECADSVCNLETTAFQMLRELHMSVQGNVSTSASSNSLSQPVGVNPPGSGGGVNGTPDGEDDEVAFDVKIEGISGKKQTILVNLKEGKLRFCKVGESSSGGLSYEQHQVLQLVKSRSKEQRLGVLMEGQSRKDYVFNSMQAREQFCQLVQLLRNRMSVEDKDSATIFVGTWNMGDALPPPEMSTWLRSLGIGKTLPSTFSEAHDLYAFGTQETGPDKEWAGRLKASLKALYDVDYEKVASHTLWGIRLVIFVKPEHSKKIAHLQFSQVRTGIGNALGNKGGVGISFHFGNLSLCFINCHLTSGGEKCSRRNQNYHDILRGMGTLKHKRLSQFDLTNQFHHLFFFGDLNYRVDLGATEIVEFAKQCKHYSIYQEDQLRKDKQKKKIFVGFDESTILFPPTYRFAKNRRTLDDYVWVKQKRSGIRINVPSYCDRVLWKSYPGSSLINTSYGCTSDIMTSDHSPVFATFQIGGVKQYVSDKAGPAGMPSSSGEAFIIVDSCSAKIQTSSKTYFYIELMATCFEGVVKTAPNNDWLSCVEGDQYVKPVWRSREAVAKIKPIVTEQEYLEQQHLLFMLKSQESDEPYAECCVCLNSLIGCNPVHVQTELIHQALYVGDLEASIHVTLSNYKEKSVEEELYGSMNFITADPDQFETSLDRPKSSTSESSEGSNYRRSNDPLLSRPRLPLPGSVPDPAHPSSRHSSSSSTTPSTPPPPLPRRRPDTGGSSRPLPPMGIPTPFASRPAVLTRRSESMGLQRTKPEIAHRQDRFDRGGSGSTDTPPSSQSPVKARAATSVQDSPTMGGPPIRTKRKPAPHTTSSTQRPPSFINSRSDCDPPPPSSSSSPLSQSLPVKQFHMPLVASGSAGSGGGGGGGHAPRLPPRNLESGGRGGSPPPPISKQSDPAQPPVPRRQRNSQRPISSVEKLLASHGLQHFTERLMENGYDDINFLCEVSEDELIDIGFTQAADRTKLIQIFTSK